ncbi:MarR family winged helix-turn-helix transcriptional regulator [Lentibacillus jeotgali]|uniref:MarR family winged helix-turn-helix transcriptional regulator n=1 Tax=Lentibacillus jeotgali TaxID=558169 RepID=UPI000262882A|nr:winged helix DNA-binding protein [Lentibacillus jeotgali]
MSQEYKNLDLIDALSERHHQLRKITEQLWNENSDIKLSNSEWFIMARIYEKQPAIAYVTKNVDISRQATHKFIKKLEAKGLVEINSVKDNKKNKHIRLTELGEECYEKNEALKAEQERKIADKIGYEQLQLLKDILKADWGL